MCGTERARRACGAGLRVNAFFGGGDRSWDTGRGAGEAWPRPRSKLAHPDALRASQRDHTTYRRCEHSGPHAEWPRRASPHPWRAEQARQHPPQLRFSSHDLRMAAWLVRCHCPSRQQRRCRQHWWEGKARQSDGSLSPAGLGPACAVPWTACLLAPEPPRHPAAGRTRSSDAAAARVGSTAGKAPLAASQSAGRQPAPFVPSLRARWACVYWRPLPRPSTHTPLVAACWWPTTAHASLPAAQASGSIHACCDPRAAIPRAATLCFIIW